MTKQKTTVYIDSDVLTATKAAALTLKRSESAVIEDALRTYLRSGHGETASSELSDLFLRVASRSNLEEDEAMALAVEAVHAVRRERRSPKMRGE